MHNDDDVYDGDDENVTICVRFLHFRDVLLCNVLCGFTAKLAYTCIVECVSDLCPPGKYFVVRDSTIVCIDCDIGRYSDTEMVEECTACPNDQVTHETGSTSENKCIGKSDVHFET